MSHTEKLHAAGGHDTYLAGCRSCARRERRKALHAQANERRPAVIVQKIHAASIRSAIR